jgi:aspartyl-tRNA synthetase
MSEIKAALAKLGKKLSDDDDFDPESERMAGEYAFKKYGEEFIFVTNFPWETRPFYHMKPEGDKKGTKSFDLLWNGLEVATGAQREHRYDILKSQAKEKGVDLDEMKDYAMLFQYGPVPHGGVGLGLDRFMESLLKLDNIREGILLPRDPVRLNP